MPLGPEEKKVFARLRDKRRFGPQASEMPNSQPEPGIEEEDFLESGEKMMNQGQDTAGSMSMTAPFKIGKSSMTKLGSNLKKLGTVEKEAGAESRLSRMAMPEKSITNYSPFQNNGMKTERMLLKQERAGLNMSTPEGQKRAEQIDAKLAEFQSPVVSE